MAGNVDWEVMQHLPRWKRVGTLVVGGLHTFSRSLHLPEGFADSFSGMVIVEIVSLVSG